MHYFQLRRSSSDRERAFLVPRIHPLSYEDASPPARAEFEKQIREHGRMTNMKMTLAHSWPALRALMEWYPLRDEVAAFLGDRLTTIFAHAISTETDCLVCSTFFRRALAEAGEDPESFALDAWEQTVVDFGQRIARDAHGVSDELYARLAARLHPDQIVALTAFAGIMIATNIFNDVLRVDLDEYLQAYRKPSPA
jgi:alkylhydroperoxidase family enzyme